MLSKGPLLRGCEGQLSPCSGRRGLQSSCNICMRPLEGGSSAEEGRGRCTRSLLQRLENALWKGDARQRLQPLSAFPCYTPLHSRYFFFAPASRILRRRCQSEDSSELEGAQKPISSLWTSSVFLGTVTLPFLRPFGPLFYSRQVEESLRLQGNRKERQKGGA